MTDPTNAYLRIRHNHPHVYADSKADFPWDTLTMPISLWDVFSRYYEIILSVAWLSALSGPTRWRYFHPRTLIESLRAIKDTLASALLIKHSNDYLQTSLSFSQYVLLLSQASAALAQCAALVIGIPTLGLSWIVLGVVDQNSGWPLYLTLLILPPVMLVGGLMLIGVSILLGIVVGFILAVVSFVIQSVLMKL